MNKMFDTVLKLQEVKRVRVSEPKSLFETSCRRFTENTESDKYILMTYEIVTEESAEYGDVAERGWSDENHNHYETYPEDIQGEEEPPHIEFELDEFDIEEGLTIVDKVVEFLKKEYVTEASNYPFSPGSWYTAYGEDNDDTVNYSYHLYGFTPEEEMEIAQKLGIK